jgi:anhydro-N-acetylmuramic acid kinase
MSEMKSFRIIGLMSGTSIDGLDLADVEFSQSENGTWSFKLMCSETIDYTEEFRKRLRKAPFMTGENLGLLSVELGLFYGQEVLKFIDKHKISKDLITAIASHGQTIFHQPDKGFTLQIGNGPELTTVTGIKSIVDFRTKDVALGGNGAPLVPVADDYLFSNLADSFLNIGGFANISFKKKDWLSFDICPANIVLNEIMQHFNKSFDFNGDIGRSAKINPTLTEELNNLNYYFQEGPKSLGSEWVEREVLTILENEDDESIKLGTFYSHIAYQISKSLEKNQLKSVFITGGGAKNSFLIDLIKRQYRGEVIIPEKDIIDFKEAIAFAFLGVLRLNNSDNVYSSVTGARDNSCSGVIFTP